VQIPPPQTTNQQVKPLQLPRTAKREPSQVNHALRPLRGGGMIPLQTQSNGLEIE
jgi:hypothetical protein